MANPVVTVTYNKTTYTPGEQIVATVSYSDADTRVTQDVWSGVNDNGDRGTFTVERNVVDPVTIQAPAGFTKVSPGNGTPQTWHGTA